MAHEEIIGIEYSPMWIADDSMLIKEKLVRNRDNQRSKVYAWERTLNGNSMYRGTMKSVDEVATFAKPIWCSERGRYGHAKKEFPLLQAGRGARAFDASHRIVLGRWARNPWVVLHEMAHLLAKGDRHGPRFVGCLIGLAARHLGRDTDEMVALAHEQGVNVDLRSIGRVPVYSWAKRVEKLLPGTLMELAVELGVSYRVVQGAAMRLVRDGKARWRGKKLIQTGLGG